MRLQSIDSKFVYSLLFFSLAFTSSNALSEFLHSFLTRSHHLPNASKTSVNEVTGPLVIVVHVDNWSPFELKYRSHRFGPDESLEQNLASSSLRGGARHFLLQSVSADASSKGLVALDLLDASRPEGMRTMDVISMAWDVGSDNNLFSLGVGDAASAFNALFDGSNAHVAKSARDDNVGKLVFLTRPKYEIALQSQCIKDRNKTQECRLRLVLVPAKMDVWGWVKYYKEGNNALDKRRHVKSKKNEKNDNNNNKFIESNSKSERLFDQKHLLSSSSQLSHLLSTSNASTVDLKWLVSSQATLAILLENWSRFTLMPLKNSPKSGTTFNVAKAILPGEKDVLLYIEESSFQGIYGVASWHLLGCNKTALSVMYSVPYSLQFHSSWFGLGLAENSLDFDTMYYERNLKFRREKASSGMEIDFANSRFMIIGRMEGGMTGQRAVLHVGVVPLNEVDLALGVRKRIGMHNEDAKPDVIPENFTNLIEPQAWNKANYHCNLHLSTLCLAIFAIFNLV